MSVTTLFKRKRQSAAVHNAAQRLNAENQKNAYLVGLIKGGGWFSFSKNGKLFNL